MTYNGRPYYLTLNGNFFCLNQVNETIVSKRAIYLVCHGLDTVATLYINQRLIGSTDNMFVRYKFDIKPYVRYGRNEISISFESPVTYAKRIHDYYIHSHYVVPPGNY